MIQTINTFHHQERKRREKGVDALNVNLLLMQLYYMTFMHYESNFIIFPDFIYFTKKEVAAKRKDPKLISASH